MMRNSDKFIDCYNKIDEYLREKGNFTRGDSFFHKVKTFSRKDRTINQFKEELFSFAELRNAIVHTTLIDEEPIAEPHLKTLERFEKIFETITNPPTVGAMFRFPVLGAQKEDSIHEILIQLEKHSFSQFPVFEGNRVVELINTNTIARWIANKLDTSGSCVIIEAKVKELIDHIEFTGNYQFIAKTDSIFDAYARFQDHIKIKKTNLDALLITENGTSAQKPLGLITIEDIAHLFKPML